MYTKDWYKESYKKCKRSLAWYKTCCASQAAKLRELEAEIIKLNARIKEVENDQQKKTYCYGYVNLMTIMSR